MINGDIAMAFPNVHGSEDRLLSFHAMMDDMRLELGLPFNLD
jgi:hypothetical protein